MAAAVVLTMLVPALAVAHRFDPLPQGLEAQYFPNASWTPPGISIRDRQPSTEGLIQAWHGTVPDRFTAEWTGAIVILRSGTYTFATRSDDGSWVFVDGRLIVDNGGLHSAKLVTATVPLESGVHPLLIRYLQAGGDLQFDLLWARDGSELQPVPAWVLRPRKVRSLARVWPSLAGDTVLATAEWAWVVVLVLAAIAAVWPVVVRTRRFLAENSAWRALRWIVAASILLNVIGIWWGLPGKWVTIELDPSGVLYAISRRFGGGWYDWYPPLQFYFLTVALVPAMLLQALGRLSMDTGAGYSVSVVICRLVSVAAATGVVIAAALCGTRAFGRRAGLFAAAIIALTTPFVYYAKTANVDVPYLFWVALSFVFYLRMAVDAPLRDFVLFAACATLATCTKDQAYGLYVLVPPLLVVEIWRANRTAGRPHAWIRSVFDRRLLVAAVTAIALFAVCHNVLFNAAGFASHVRLLTGGTAALFRVVEPTAAGRLRLVGLTVRLIQVSFGWPLFVLCLGGLVIAAASRGLRPIVAWLMLPLVSYYLTVINIVLYNYDRFVLPMCFVLALFGGLAVDRFLAWDPRRLRAWRAPAVGGVFAYTLLYASTVDVLMLQDSRYVVERWMRQHIRPEDSVATTGLREYLPRVDGFTQVDVGTVADLERDRPDYVVLNADYVRAVRSDSPWGRLISGVQDGTLGYRLAYRHRHGSPWPWLPGAHPDLAGPRQGTVVLSTLRNIDPTIEIFQRLPAPSR